MANQGHTKPLLLIIWLYYCISCANCNICICTSQ